MSEKRALSTTFEMRGVPGDGAQLIGYAARFDVEAIIGGVFREVVSPGAFKKTLRESDVRATADHDTGRVVGRSKGGPRNLLLGEDESGLHTVLDVPDTPTARSLYADIEAGLIDSMSFTFDPVNENARWWKYRDGELPLRTMRELKLYEVSYVAFPAYEGASVEARSVLVAHAQLWKPQQLPEDRGDDAVFDSTTPEPEPEPESLHSEPTHEPEQQHEDTMTLLGL